MERPHSSSSYTHAKDNRNLYRITRGHCTEIIASYIWCFISGIGSATRAHVARFEHILDVHKSNRVWYPEFVSTQCSNVKNVNQNCYCFSPDGVSVILRVLKV